MHYDKPVLDDALANFTSNNEQPGALVRLGTAKQTGEPVIWQPENTVQVASANLALVGRENTGNTQLLESIVIQLLRQKAQAGEPLGILICNGMDDYTESRSTFAEAIGARVMRLHKLPMNPFSLRGLERRPQLHTHTAMTFADALARAYGLGALQKSTLVQSILAAYSARGITSDPLTWDRTPPSFYDVHREYRSRPSAQREDALAPVMENPALLDLFDENVPEDGSAWDLVRDVVILDMSGYSDALKHFALGILLERLSARLSALPRTLNRRFDKLILVDNADPLLNSGNPGLEELLSQGCDHGLGVLLSAENPDCFRQGDFDFRRWIPTRILHDIEDLRKTDLEFLLGTDIHDSALEQLYQVSRHLQKLHSLVHREGAEPVLMEDLPFYEIADDTAQRYLQWETPEPEPEPLAGMPLLDASLLDTLVDLDDDPAGPMATLETF